MKSFAQVLLAGGRGGPKVQGACRQDELDNFQGSPQNENETSPPCSKSMKNAKTVAAEHQTKHGVRPSEIRALRSQAPNGLLQGLHRREARRKTEERGAQRRTEGRPGRRAHSVQPAKTPPRGSGQVAEATGRQTAEPWRAGVRGEVRSTGLRAPPVCGTAPRCWPWPWEPRAQLLRVQEPRPTVFTGDLVEGAAAEQPACLSQEILPPPRSEGKFVVTTKVIFVLNQTAYTPLLIGVPWALSTAFLLLPLSSPLPFPPATQPPRSVLTLWPGPGLITPLRVLVQRPLRSFWGCNCCQGFGWSGPPIRVAASPPGHDCNQEGRSAWAGYLQAVAGLLVSF